MRTKSGGVQQATCLHVGVCAEAENGLLAQLCIEAHVGDLVALERRGQDAGCRRRRITQAPPLASACSRHSTTACLLLLEYVVPLRKHQRLGVGLVHAEVK